MRLVIRTIWLTAALAALAAGCGDDGGETTPGPTGISLEELPPKYAEVLCDALRDCSGLFGEIIGESGCEAEFEKQLTDTFIPQVEGYLADKTVVYHADKVQACLDAIKAGGCDVLNGVSPAACEDAIEGTVASGGDCDATTECAGSDFCAFESSSCPGKCTALKSEGSPCDGEDNCQDGLTCQSGSMPDQRTCRKPAASGEACDGASAPDCEAGLACIGAMGSTSGSCKSFDQIQTKGLGEVCDFEKGELCQEGLSCSIEQVSATPTFKCVGASATGAACRPGIPDPCPADEYCDADLMTGSADGICHKLPTDGQACVDTPVPFGPLCATAHVCDGTQTCRARQTIGGACVEDGICYSETCESGKCAAPPACDAPDTTM
jgi:hypothetical protein